MNPPESHGEPVAASNVQSHQSGADEPGGDDGDPWRAPLSGIEVRAECESPFCSVSPEPHLRQPGCPGLKRDRETA